MIEFDLLTLKHGGEKMRVSVFLIMVLMLAVSGAVAGDARLQRFDNGIVSIDVPSGWDVFLAGQCAELAVVLRDRSQPLRQVFYFGSVGPVYMSQRQKQLDQQYMSMGGYPVPWIEMPVIEPLTPENFLVHFEQITATQAARQFMPQAPRLAGFEPVSASPTPSPLGAGQAALVRGLFHESGRLGEGLFSLSAVPFMPEKGGPGGGNAYGFMVCGVTAPKEEFAALQPLLTASLASLRISPQYAGQCMTSSQEVFQRVVQAGQTLRETSDMIMAGWEGRNRSQDVMAEKRADAIRGYDRVYNPDSGETYHVEPGFWDRYDQNRNTFELSNLQRLPDNDHGLWTSPPRDQREIR
jgi:hypothetical protein